MRIALPLLTLATAGCLSSPDGVARTWPPALAKLDVVAVAAGDVDNDGKDDLIVVSAGTAADGAGVYLLRGGVDLAPSTTAPLASFSAYRPIDGLASPAAAIVMSIGGTPTVLVAYGSPTGAVDVAALQGAQLTISLGHATGLTAASSDRVWMHPIAFPGNNPRLLVGVGPNVVHASPADLLGTAAAAFNPMPGPSNTWSPPPDVGTSFTNGAEQDAVIATPTAIERSAIPTKPPEQGGMFSWTSVRTGAMWTGQTAFDLDGNGRDEIVGFQPGNGASGSLCAVDPGTAAGAACTATMITDSGAVVMIGNIDGSSAPDAILATGGSSGTNVSFLIDLAYTGALLTSQPTHPPHATPIANGLVTVLPTADHDDVIVVGKDGTAACVALAAGGAVVCH